MPRSLPTPSIRLAGLLIAAILLAIPFHVRPDNFVVDDGFFYPQIARFIAHGQGSTFNGIMPTNGYHPLWMVVCIAGATLTSNSSALLQILTVVQDLLTLLALTFLFLICEAEKKRGVIFGCVPLVFFAMVLGIWRLLEANLSLALQMIVLLAVVPAVPALQARFSRWRNLKIGLLLGLTLLARLDLIFFAAVILVYELFHGWSTEPVKRVRSVTIQGLVTALVVSPYLLWNQITFHHLQPVSGAIKSSFPHIQDWHPRLFVFPVMASILFSGFLLLRRTRTNFDLLCLLTAAAAALHMAYTLSFGGLSAWYLTTGYLNVALCIVLVADRVLGWMPKIPVELAFGSMIFLVFLLMTSLRLFSNFSYTRVMLGEVSFRGRYLEPKAALAVKLRESLPAGSRIFTYDAPGGVAFYSGMGILPADGLITDYKYSEDLRREGFAAYTTEHHIDYFIAPYLQPGQSYDRLYLSGTREGSTQLMNVHVPLGDSNAGSMSLDDKNLLFRSQQLSPDLEKTYPELGVWRIQH